MGKAKWVKDIYVAGCEELGVDRLSVKVSSLSSRYNRNKNYAGLVVYHHKGKFKWRNDCGIAKGYSGRGIYILIACTDDWPTDAFKRAGQGMVHDYLYKMYFGCSYSEKKSCCGGFAIMKGKVKYSSIWLNKQSRSAPRNGWTSDGDKMLSAPEIEVVDLAVEAWVRQGPGVMVEVPQSMDATFRFGALLSLLD